MDSWETRYGEQRAAAIDRLEQLCLEKHHLKMPSLTTNQNSKAKKKTVDVSQLKAPTPSMATAIEDAQQSIVITSKIETAKEEPTRAPVKVGKISVTAKPHGIRSSFAPVGSGKIVSSRKSLSSPEPMSTGGDSERSRSPSPIKEEKLDNSSPAIHASNATSSEIAQDNNLSALVVNNNAEVIDNLVNGNS